MERFGIFELLDALSALPREGADQRAEAGQESPAKEESLWRAPPEGGGARGGVGAKAPLSDGGTARGREDGTSPAAEEGASPAPKAPDGRAAHDPAPKALESFLKRHDALSKKAEKK